MAICVRIMSCRMTFWNPNFCICREKNLMNRLQQAVLALYDYDDAPDNISVENTLEQGLNILASAMPIRAKCTGIIRKAW